MKTKKLRGIAIAMMLFPATMMPRVAQACAMCGLSPGDSAGHAYNTSVLFMLAGPYVTVAAIGGIVFVAWRRAHKERQ